ncbi:MAG TPA: phosphatidylserine decarboxylase [Sedimentisphaerales bacterium]|nr:phosphatidylserine decarboxylase [Sedimentisphaerales bacterium]
MRIPLTKYGLPQVAVFPAAVAALMIICILAAPSYLPAWSVFVLELLGGLIFIWVLSFFRDPYRPLPLETDILLAPADGTITDIETVDEHDFINGPALRIGIFLSIFDAHINRAPCNVKVEKITYKKGKYKNAANPQSGRVNEANTIYMTRTDNPPDRLIVRQISGAIARRIVCRAREGGQLTAGQKFGMIKFGSRTELYLPVRENVKPLVEKGDKVKAGLTPLIKYEDRGKRLKLNSQ